jgi:hypothetical protein
LFSHPAHLYSFHSFDFEVEINVLSFLKS